MDEGLQTPPSPPMQMSPHGLLSPKLHFDSPDLHVVVTPLSNNPSLSFETDETANQHSPYFEAYSALVTGPNHTPVTRRKQPLLSYASLTELPPSQENDQSELRSNSDSTSTANHSVASHDIAINLLDQAIKSSEDPLLSTEGGQRSLSSSSDPRSRDLLARSVAEAFIAKLVQSCVWC